MKHPAAIAVMTIALIPSIAMASGQELCIGHRVEVGRDGRMLGHLPYGQANQPELVTMPSRFSLGAPCRLRPEAAADLSRMLTDATSAGLGGQIKAISCYRTVERQRAVFCGQIGPGKRCKNPAERARYVGPPGYSEHSTGYALDFGTRPSGGCTDLEACFANTRAGRWLLANASDYGFELSFPAGNAQGVTWEPWHWRWVGTAVSAPGAGPARAIFARARTSYPARPMHVDAPIAAAPAPEMPPAAPPPGEPLPQ